MHKAITTETVVAYVHCQRKAYYLLRGEPLGTPHDLEQILESRAAANRGTYVKGLAEKTLHQLGSTWESDSQAIVSSSDLVAVCNAVTKRNGRSGTNARSEREPHLVVGTSSVSNHHKLAVAYAGYVIGKAERKAPSYGLVVRIGGGTKRVKLASLYPQVRSIVNNLREFSNDDTSEPPLLLCNACPTCPFRNHCHQEAEQTDNLTLLDRMTPKLIKKYARRGVFTVNQLSYLFRPRRARKRSSVAQPSFNIELQSLAIRTKKIYLHEPPTFREHPIELYLDIEGIPDQDFHYLIGLLIKNQDNVTMRSFWADTAADEPRIFQECIGTINAFPSGTPVLHYGSYEQRAFQKAKDSHGIKCDAVIERLVNVNSMIYGKIYFPTRSNRLKDLGEFLGASWSAPSPMGLQSLAWRFLWEDTCNEKYKQMLLTYNCEDCEALRIVTGELQNLSAVAHERPDVDVPTISKRNSTPAGRDIHETFDRILKSAHLKYKDKRITLRSDTAERQDQQEPTKKRRRPTVRRTPSGRVNKIIQVPRKRTCLNCKNSGLRRSSKVAEHSILELARTKTGCRKMVVKYLGHQARCSECGYYYSPPAIKRLNGQLFGRSIKCWAVYFRIILRLPIRVISDLLDTLISEYVAQSCVNKFVEEIAEQYAATEELLQTQILASSFLHVDETQINVRGVKCYAWVLTDGRHVVFKFSEGRQISAVEGILADYDGVLISDFYGGYDSLPCRQQRCLVHLIRDLNEDLWKNPFNEEYEAFVSDLRDLFVPIFEDVGKRGLKSRYLKKHMRSVDRIYRNVIERSGSGSELVERYKKRFQRYRESLFRFLTEDGIPWNNNMAERALRHLSVQQKISGFFFSQTGAHTYLRLLSISQTCRFQDKPFLDFLLSDERDVDQFKPARRRRKRRT